MCVVLCHEELLVTWLCILNWYDTSSVRYFPATLAVLDSKLCMPVVFRIRRLRFAVLDSVLGPGDSCVLILTVAAYFFFGASVFFQTEVHAYIYVCAENMEWLSLYTYICPFFNLLCILSWYDIRRLRFARLGKESARDENKIKHVVHAEA